MENGQIVPIITVSTDQRRNIPTSRYVVPTHPDNIAQILADVDIVLLPSLWSENAPLVMLLALRYGVPVMASRIGGIPEWVRDTINGWLVAPGDPIAWAKAMAHCIEHRDRIKDRAGNCRYPLTSEDEAKALVRVYQSSAGQRE